ncbi:Mg2+ transporter protein, CorA-like/Zinc transport protein ZntB [Paramyrothecium foliicola]|nr:Mg2+ transporter protein, CorA-like/Zinc transport protein ZntB [Paramyrothecium foliicola]
MNPIGLDNSSMNGGSSLLKTSSGFQSAASTQVQTLPLRQQAVEHVKINLDDEGLHLNHAEGSTIETLLAWNSASPPQTNELQIFFLPPIHVDKDDRPADPDFKTLLEDPELCKELTQTLNLDESFFTEEAWNSNGFLRHRQGFATAKDTAHSYATRFLIKFLQAPGMLKTPKYSWLFLAVSVLWVQPEKGKLSCIMVCYDDCSKIRDEILDAFKSYPRANIKENAFSVYDALLQAIVMQYDQALWLFRTPVRNIEKNRRRFALSIKGLPEQDLSNGEGVIGSHIAMHELSRHAIHMSETLQVAAKTVKSTLRHFESHLVPNQPGPTAVNIIAGLHYSSSVLANLKLRADAFVSRIDNEIQLAYNIISIFQLQDTQRLLQESRDDGKDMTTIVTSLTLIFLPATFVAGFWGMNFITMEGGRTVIGRDVWKFWLSAALAVVACCVMWILVHYYRWRPSLRPFRPFNHLKGQRRQQLKGD